MNTLITSAVYENYKITVFFEDNKDNVENKIKTVAYEVKDASVDLIVDSCTGYILKDDDLSGINEIINLITLDIYVEEYDIEKYRLFKKFIREELIKNLK